MSLRLKLTIAIAALVLALGIGGTLHARFTLTSIYRDQLEKRSQALAADLANRVAEALVTNDVFSLYQSMNQVILSNEDVRYAFILGPDGRVRADSFAQGLPAGLREANGTPAGDGASIVRLDSDEGGIVDVAAPVLGGRAGTVRLGLSERPLQARVNSLTFTLLALTGAVLGIGFIVAWALATVLTRPLARLAQAAGSIGRGELSVRVPGRTKDEVGRLAEAFNRMADALDRSHLEIQRKEEVRTQLLAKIIAAQEEERQRIARELHDETAQTLTALLMALESSQEAPSARAARGAMNRAYRLATSLLTGTRRLILDLRPAALDEIGLVPALRLYAEERLGTETQLAVTVNGFQERLPPQVEMALFRVFQEAVNNCVRHAHARHVAIGLERRDGRVLAWVEDDGVGFDKEAVLALGREKAPLGLLGMQERAELAGGRLSIESSPGRGTRVTVELPTGE